MADWRCKPSYRPTLPADLFNLAQTQLQGDADFSNALEASLNQVLPALQELGILPALPNSANVVLQTLLDLGQTDLQALVAGPLQQALFEAALQGIESFDLAAFAPGLTDLFSNVPDIATLEVQVGSALAQLETLGLLAESVSVEAVLNAAELRLGAQELGNLSATALAERLLSGLNELQALDLGGILPAGQAQTLVEQFQTQLEQGADLLDSLQGLVSQAQALLDADLFSGGLPDAALLLSSLLPELVADKLQSLTAGDLQNSVFAALNELDAFDLSRFIPNGVAGDLLNTFNQARAGGSLTDATQATLTEAVTQPEFIAAISGNIPNVDEVLQGFITELTPGLDGLSGFIDRILTPPLNGIRTALFQVLGEGGLDLLPDDIPSADEISDQIPKILFNAVLRGLTDGDITGALQTALTDALGPLGLGIIERGEALAADVQEQILAEIQTRIEDPLNGLFGVDALLNEAFDDLFGADVVDVVLENNILNFNLALDKGVGLDDVALDADVGLPGIGLKTGGSLDLGAAFEMDLGFGFDLNQRELSIDTSAEEELRLALQATLDALDARANLGFLQFDADTNGEPNGLDLGFGINLSDEGGNNDGKLTLQELGAIALTDLITPTVNGRFDLNLGLESSINGSDLLPVIAADFALGAVLEGLDIDEAFDTANIAFNNIKLDLGTFLGGFADTVLGTVQELVEPLEPIINILTKKVPVIDASFLDLAKNPLFSNALEAVEGSEQFVEAIIGIVELLQLINAADGAGQMINLGSFQVAGVTLQDEETGTSKAQLFLLPNLLEGGNFGALALEDGTPDVTNPDTDPLEQLKAALGEVGEGLEEKNDLFKFPILTDPSAIANLLLGKDDVVLFELTPPPLKIDFEYEQTIPIVGPISAVIRGGAGAAATLEFGYDSFGLQKFRDSGFTTPGLLAEGLFAKTGDLPEPPFPLPQEPHTVGVGAGIGVGVGVEVVVGSVDVTAELLGNAFLDLVDPDTGESGVDVKIRIEDLGNPGCIFEVSGQIDAALAATIEVGFGPFKYKKRFEILRETLAEGRTDPCHTESERRDENQAVREDDGTLVLTTTDNRDQIIVEHLEGDLGSETVDVIRRIVANNGQTEHVPNSYADITRILGEAKDGDDFIEIGDGVLSPATLRGNDGNDNLKGGDGNDLIEGGNDSDNLEGGLGDDEIFGNSGDDFVRGGGGNDTLDGGENDEDLDTVSYAKAASGVNVNQQTGVVSDDGDGGVDSIANFERIEGSQFDDRIVGDDEDNTLDGLDGDDLLQGEGGDDFFVGGRGADTIDGGREGENGDAVSYIESVAGVSVNLLTSEVFSGGGSDADGDRLIDIENVQGSAFADTLVGNGKNNRLGGELGDDTIDGGEGADILDGGAGIDEVSFQSLNAGVVASLKEGKATSIEAGQTVEDELVAVEGQENTSSFENLRGSNFDDDLEGDIRNNEIRGEAGDDTLRGDGGSDTLIGGAGADLFDGGEGIDTADYSESTEGVRVEMRAAGSGGDAEGDTFAFKGDTDFATTVENLVGSDFGDILIADGNDNQIDPGLSNGEVDFVDGQQGPDRLFVDYSQRDIGQGIRTEVDFDDEGTNRISRLEQNSNEILDAVEFVSMRHLTLIGTRQDDQVTSESGDDVLLTGGGDDTIQTGRGSDIVQAGTGNDTMIAQDTNGVLSRQFAGGEDFFFLDGGAGTDTVSINLSSRTEDIVINSPDPAAGAAGVNVLFEDGSTISNFEIFKDGVLGRGDDQFTQLGRVDNVVDLNGGSNTANLGLGIDQVFGSRDGDNSDTLTVDYSVGDIGSGLKSDQPTDSGQSSGSTGRYFRFDNDGNLLDEIRYENINTVRVFGTEQADEIVTDNRRGNGLLVGNGGDDTITELGGRSRLEGGDGDDTLSGGNDLDGGAGNDLLDSGFGNDTLNGGAGNDILIGTKVRTNASFLFDEDVMTGGTGADEFRLADLESGERLYFDNFAFPNESFARITDFNREEGDFLRLAGPERFYISRVEDGNTSIFVRNNLGDDVFLTDLIAVLEGVTDFNFDTDAVFVDPVIIVNSEPGEPILLDVPAIADDGEMSIMPVSSPETDEATLLDVPETGDDGEMSIMPVSEGEAAALAESNGFVVEQNNDGTALLEQLLGNTNGLSNIRVQTKGDARAFGTFLNDPFGLGSGVVLSTGKVEDLASVNEEDGDFSAGETIKLNFEKLEGVTGQGERTAVFRADLSQLGIDLESLSIADSGNGGGASGIFTGFDLDGVKLSRVRVDNAEQVNAIAGLDVFDFSPLGTVLVPGTQRDPNAGSDLSGSINGFVNNGIATLSEFDAFGVINNPDGAVTIGDQGRISFNLTDKIASGSGEPLFLYIGEAGNNEEAPDGDITVSNRRIGEGGLLSTDFGLKGSDGDTAELVIDFTANDQLRDLIFQFAFGSEEFVEFAGSQFNDIFELELNGFNLARLSDGQAASINTLALSPVGQFHPDFINNSVEAGPAVAQTGLDGFTNTLTFSGAVKPNAENRLLIRVKDVQDGLLDSAVFLKAGTVLSDPVPGIVVLDNDGLIVSEDGLTDSFDVVLSTVPTETVTVTITPDDQLDLGQGANEPIVLTFTPENARTAQTVNVAAIDDQIFEALHNGTLRFSVSSDDIAYDDVFVPHRIAKITDNEATADIVLTDAGDLKVSEDGLTDTFAIALSTVPSDVVTVTLAADPQLDFGAGPNRGTTLTFTPEDALTPQQITVAAVDDAVREGTHTGQIAFTVESNDGAYDGLSLNNQSVRITDNDADRRVVIEDLNGETGFAIPGIDPGDASGTSVSYVGDINNDGFGDVVIGAPGASDGRGESYVVFGREDFPAFIDLTELNGSNGFRLDGIANGDQAGVSVSSAGDVNDDGIADLIIGARGHDANGSNSGESYVVLGRNGSFARSLSLGSLNGSNGFAISGIGVGDGAGVTVSGAGDFNNDGVDDVIVGSLSANKESYVVFGRRNGFASRINLSGLNGVNGVKLVGFEFDTVNFELEVDTLGDINGDGIDDIIIGNNNASPNGQQRAGKSFVVFGQNSGFGPTLNVSQLNGNNGFVLNGSNALDISGTAVSGAGDVNGDGIEDLIIGASAVGGIGPNDPAPNSGESYVVFGRQGGFSPSLALNDLDGSNGFKIQVDAVNQRLGIAVSEAGDFNGDGIGDLLVGADQGGTIASGRSFVIFGQRDGFDATFDVFRDLNSSTGLEITSSLNERQLLGSAVSAAGDVNGDGVDDIVVGARNANPGGKERAGESYVIFGNAVPAIDLNGDETGIDLDVRFLIGEDSAIALGDQLTVSDVNSANLVRATVSIKNGQDGDHERLTIDTSGTNIEATFQNGTLFLIGIDTVETYQQVLRTVNYVNTSANPDLTPRQIEFVASDGEAFSNRSTPAIATLNFQLKSAVQELSDLNGSNGFTINGIDTNDASGLAVSAAGDVNGDGLDDFLIGASGAGSNGKENSGESYLIFGRKDDFPAKLELSNLKKKDGVIIRGIDADDTRTGIAVSGAGDVNDDGFDDLIIGARNAQPNGVANAGESYVVFGKSNFGAQFPLQKLNGKNGFVLEGFESGFVGTSVSGVGDFDGDGYDDVLVGANSADPSGRLNAGESYLVFGQGKRFDADFNLAELDGHNGFAIRGAAAADLAGTAVSGGDFNGDGLSDLFIGASSADPNGVRDAGEAYVVFGRSDRGIVNIDLANLSAEQGLIFQGVEAGDLTGNALKNAGDINGDGLTDLVIGARRSDRGDQTDAGRAYVVFGRQETGTSIVNLADLDGSNGFVMEGIDRLDEAGFAVSGVGDLNGDGFGDLIVGARKCCSQR